MGSGLPPVPDQTVQRQVLDGGGLAELGHEERVGERERVALPVHDGPLG